MLYISSILVEPALTYIGKIDQRDIGNSVKISGSISDVKLNPQGHVFLTIEDSTGQIRASIFNQISKKIDSSLFFAGNLIEISGTLDEFRGQLQIIPKNSRDVKITETYATKISEVLNDNSSNPIKKIQGKIEKQYNVGENLVLKLSDGSGSISIFLPNDLVSELELAHDSKLEINDIILVGGALTKYKGTFQILAKDVKIIEKQTILITPISQITRSFLNNTVKIEGTIAQIIRSKKGHLFLKIKDSTGAIEVPLFSTVVNQLKGRGLDPATIEVNDAIRVKGVVREYEGQLQVVPRSAKDVEL
ncbi:MAG: exodeoxyribonuclease VII large subunit [Euryarchaeota archaeon]|nr:exodeoxyribonuclease VII large subunit [Euryarchaeota archaeon]